MQGRYNNVFRKWGICISLRFPEQNLQYKVSLFGIINVFNMKKSKLRAGLFCGIAMSSFFILRNLWIIENFTTKSILTIILLGIMGGAITGILVYLMEKFSKFTGSNVNIDIEADENVLFESPANHYKGVEAVGGKLFLTNKKLIFKSHKFNIQNHEFSISLDEIVKTNKYKNIGINNGLSILCRNGKTEKFVVEEPEKWIVYFKRIN